MMALARTAPSQAHGLGGRAAAETSLPMNADVCASLRGAPQATRCAPTVFAHALPAARCHPSPFLSLIPLEASNRGAPDPGPAPAVGLPDLDCFTGALLGEAETGEHQLGQSLLCSLRSLPHLNHLAMPGLPVLQGCLQIFDAKLLSAVEVATDDHCQDSTDQTCIQELQNHSIHPPAFGPSQSPIQIPPRAGLARSLGWWVTPTKTSSLIIGTG